jgi:4-phospho-D-threonate 3-dehydrogenase / 4-phospho-D-erythronate 3-dehydrogenase
LNNELKKQPKKIGITIGDVAGIGPEVVLKALDDLSLLEICIPVVIGDFQFLEENAKQLNLAFDVLKVSCGDSIPENPEKVVVYDMKNVGEHVALGKDSAIGGRASAEYIEEAVDLCLKGKLDAISTAPISKQSLSLGGYDFPGHTEFLAYLTNTEEFAMSFFADKLRVVLMSTHVSLSDAIKFVTKEALIRSIKLTNRELAKLLKRKPSIVIAGLNPHASEGGLFGNEERDEIIPAIESCRKMGIDVRGVFAADTIYLRAWRGEFDSVIACYHDQATIAVKCLSFGSGVNVTLGLPFVRTSVDHGTAFDIAGKNIAESESMKIAIRLAAELSIDD